MRSLKYPGPRGIVGQEARRHDGQIQYPVLDHIQEDGVSDALVTVAADVCQAYGVCVQIAPQVFQLDEFGYSHPVDGADELIRDPALRQAAEDAAESCPVQAIEIAGLTAP
jgi:ferredoxin